MKHLTGNGSASGVREQEPRWNFRQPPERIMAEEREDPVKEEVGRLLACAIPRMYEASFDFVLAEERIAG